MKVIDVAKDIVFLCRKYNYSYNHTKIQRLLFLFVGFGLMNGLKVEEEMSLVINGKEVETMGIVDEQPKAWPYGPVFAKVNTRYPDIEADALSDSYALKVRDEFAKLILSETVKKYGRVESDQLTDWLKNPGSPWDSVKEIDGTGWDIEIPLDLIREYFDNTVDNIVEGKPKVSTPKQATQNGG